MTPVEAKTEPFFERRSWKVLFGISTIFALFGVGDMLQGMNADPAIANSITGVSWEELKRANQAAANLIDWQVRSGGVQLFIMAILSMVICVNGYRRGKRWAWYSFWAWTLLMIFIFLTFLTADRQPDFPRYRGTYP